jgi:hypothetical protein
VIRQLRHAFPSERSEVDGVRSNPYTLEPQPGTRNPEPQSPNPKLQIRHPNTLTLKPRPETSNLQASTINLEFSPRWFDTLEPYVLAPTVWQRQILHKLLVQAGNKSCYTSTSHLERSGSCEVIFVAPDSNRTMHPPGPGGSTRWSRMCWRPPSPSRTSLSRRCSILRLSTLTLTPTRKP